MNIPGASTYANSLVCRAHPVYKYIIQVTNGFNGSNTLSGGQEIGFKFLNIQNPAVAQL